MTDKYFEIADLALPYLLENRNRPINIIGFLTSKNIDAKQSIRLLIADLKTFGLVNSSIGTTVNENLQLTHLGIKIATPPNSFRQFIADQLADKQSTTISIKEIHIGDNIQGSSFHDFKPIVENKIQPIVESKKKFKLEFSHKIALISLIAALIVLLFGNNIWGRFMNKDSSNIKKDTTIYIKK